MNDPTSNPTAPAPTASTPKQKLAMLPACADPHEGIREHASYDGPVSLRCDVVVVGSGPGGAVAAKELAEAGRDVILVEEGPAFGVKDFTLEPGEAMHRMFREGGSRAARGTPFLPTMQAIGLGGGSVMNSAICARPPDWVFEKWAETVGTHEVTRASLDPHFDRIEAMLGVAPTPMEVQGERNLAFKRACDKLGISSEPTWRNVQGCLGSGECFTGCRNGAKRSVDITYVPAAMRAGARVLTSVRVETVSATGRKATGIRGHVVEPFTGKASHPVEIHADCVVMGAGCMATPVILERSGLCGGNGYLGRELEFHPGLAIMALFEQPIDPWKGATQGYHSLEYLADGVKFEVLWSPPAVLATRLPGLGRDFQKHLLRYDRMAPFDVITATDHSRGTVRARRGSFEPDIRFKFDQRDMDKMQYGLGILNDICWAAGAYAILPGLNGIPETIENQKDAEIIRTHKLRAEDTITAANHAFCSTRMSRDPKLGVVDESGRCHEMDNLYIVDSGIFGGSSGVNPMFTIMALADRIALGIAARW
ncbi:MAG: GMC family oxidoreductase [Polyangiaceae bacterium]|nr:GMC family oxidoreductase [Polyangiaceae bacterium]